MLRSSSVVSLHLHDGRRSSIGLVTGFGSQAFGHRFALRDGRNEPTTRRPR